MLELDSLRKLTLVVLLVHYNHVSLQQLMAVWLAGMLVEI